MERERSEGRDAGFSVIELVVASALAAVVLLIIGGMMFSSFRAQGRVATLAEASGDAQLAARQLEQHLHSASAVEVFDGDASGSQALVARIHDGDDWTCRVWFYDAVADVIFTSTYPGKTYAPWGSSITNWIDLGSGLLEVVDVRGILEDTLDWLFGGADDGVSEWSVVAIGILDETGPDGTAAPVFAAVDDRTVSLRYATRSGESVVQISDTVSGRLPYDNTEPRCF